MASILTNYSAMTALQTLRGVNNNLGETQARISTGLKVRSGKDNAAYFNISNTMRGDSGMYKSINEGLTMTKNSVATARAGAEQFVAVATEFAERVAFAQGEAVDHAAIQLELDELVGRMKTIVQQATFNGDNLVGTIDEGATPDDPSTWTVAGATDQTVVTGITRAGAAFEVTSIQVKGQNLGEIVQALAQIDLTDATLTRDPDDDGFDVAAPDVADIATFADILKASEYYLGQAVQASTSLGISEKSIEVQQDFLKTLVDEIDGGIGGMIDADMEQEASRLQALQVQQQLATQSLSIANQNPQNILALFR